MLAMKELRMGLEVEFRELQIGEDGSAFRVLNEEWISHQLCA